MKISVVMPSFNQARYVEAALNSVLDQRNSNFEILFVDGGSTDGTMDIVERYRDRLAYCVSEPDKGQSDALHRGFCKANGDILTWLNTDDLLLPGALEDVAAAFEQKRNCEWVLGNVLWIDAEDIILKCWKGEPYTPFWPRLGLFAAGGPSSFFTPNLYHRVSGLNLNLHYAMDTELWWKFILDGQKFHRLKRYTWALRLHEDAKVSGHMFAGEDDEKQKRVKAHQREERERLESLIGDYRLKMPAKVKAALATARRAISPMYLQGALDTRRYKDQPLSVLLDDLEHRLAKTT
jgi:glycosyltransferase involved in cell wall biosynthesis